MEITKESTVIVSLKVDDAKNFVSAVQKISKGDTKIGYSKSDLTDDEVKLIKALSDKL